ncbi:MAG: hypothetical protein Q4G05_03960 [Clostridia bacterium]|nr:hypothetical protein [Clostridia bacterium]MDO5557378.1 hypothetical protein [Clostridia bacterium]
MDEDDRFYTWHMGKYRDLGSGRFDSCYGLRPVIYLKTNIKTSGYSIVGNFIVSSRKKHPEAKIWELIPQRE